MKKLLKPTAGFSLVETLVAITILMVVIVGPMSISSSTAKSSSYSSEQVTAFFLAQEGVEIAQKLRDDLVLEQYPNLSDATAWDAFKDDTSSGKFYQCFRTNGCRLELDAGGDLLDTTVVNCENNLSACRLYYAPSSPPTRSYYTYQQATGAVQSPYTRVIKFTPVSGQPDEIKITSTVSWRSGNQRASQEAKVETYLFNVYGN